VSALNGANGAAALMGVVVAGEVFGLQSLLRNPVHKFQCDAFTDCVVGQIQAREFCETIARVPFNRFKDTIEMSLGRWWWGSPVWYSRMTRLPLRDRTMAMLLELSRKFGMADSRGMIKFTFAKRRPCRADRCCAADGQPGNRESGSSWKNLPRRQARARYAEHTKRTPSRAGARGGAQIVGPRNPRSQPLDKLPSRASLPARAFRSHGAAARSPAAAL
jgi:hypothetical protein